MEPQYAELSPASYSCSPNKQIKEFVSRCHAIQPKITTTKAEIRKKDICIYVLNAKSYIKKENKMIYINAY